MIALVGVACSLLAAFGTYAIGRRQANTSELQLGLNALKAGLEAATAAAAEINSKLEKARVEITRIEQQASEVLSENNRFRVIHGVLPVLSLDTFEPLSSGTWDLFTERLHSGAQQ